MTSFHLGAAKISKTAKVQWFMESTYFFKSFVDTRKVIPGSELQGTSRSSKFEIQRASSQETQEDQFQYLGIYNKALISKQSPVATKENNSVEQEDERRTCWLS